MALPTGITRMLPNTNRTTYLKPGLRSSSNEYHTELVGDRKPILGNCHPPRAGAIHSLSTTILNWILFLAMITSFELSVIDGGFREWIFPLLFTYKWKTPVGTKRKLYRKYLVALCCVIRSALSRLEVYWARGWRWQLCFCPFLPFVRRLPSLCLPPLIIYSSITVCFVLLPLREHRIELISCSLSWTLRQTVLYIYLDEIMDIHKSDYLDCFHTVKDLGYIIIKRTVSLNDYSSIWCITGERELTMPT